MINEIILIEERTKELKRLGIILYEKQETIDHSWNDDQPDLESSKQAIIEEMIEDTQILEQKLKELQW